MFQHKDRRDFAQPAQPDTRLVKPSDKCSSFEEFTSITSTGSLDFSRGHHSDLVTLSPEISFQGKY